MPIFRRKDCIHTASGIFALCKHLHSKLVESGLHSVQAVLSAGNYPSELDVKGSSQGSDVAANAWMYNCTAY
jgi:hypothetical protein